MCEALWRKKDNVLDNRENIYLDGKCPCYHGRILYHLGWAESSLIGPDTIFIGCEVFLIIGPDTTFTRMGSTLVR